MIIRTSTDVDQAAIWEILQPIFRAGDTYAIPADISRDEALAYWLSSQHRVRVVEEDGAILGTYYLKTNQQGGGAHVCNAAFATSTATQGKGIARAMLADALAQARDAGYRAMQFNFVVSTNTRAVALWERNGFQIVGRLPGAFQHPSDGYVDALVMMRDLSRA